MHIVHIIVDKLLEGQWLPAGFSSVLLALPDTGNASLSASSTSFVTRVEVLVEAANRQASFLHQLRVPNPAGQPARGISFAAIATDALMSFLLLRLASANPSEPPRK